ncbi:hypothetical protein Trydic_g3107 [Trypoxylus dichotomus]
MTRQRCKVSMILEKLELRPTVDYGKSPNLRQFNRVLNSNDGVLDLVLSNFDSELEVLQDILPLLVEDNHHPTLDITVPNAKPSKVLVAMMIANIRNESAPYEELKNAGLVGCISGTLDNLLKEGIEVKKTIMDHIIEKQLKWCKNLHGIDEEMIPFKAWNWMPTKPEISWEIHEESGLQRSVPKWRVCDGL